MARYNTVVSATSISAGTTLSTPNQGGFNEITTGSITVQLPNPALYAGSSQVFFNSSGSASTLSSSTNGGNIIGPGLTSATSQTINNNATMTLYSDGTNWIQISQAGGTLSASALSISGQITSTATTGTAPFVVSSTTNVANLNASSLNGATFASPGAIGSSSASTGAFTSLSASGTVSGSGFTSLFNSPPGAIGSSSAVAITGTSLTASNTSGTAFTCSSTTQGSSATSGNGAQFAGGVGIAGTLYTVGLVETSSIAFKENINPLTDALDTILNLTGVSYDRKDNKKHEIGLIAEDVFKFAPGLVALDENGKPYGIHYTKVSAYLIECIKTLQAEIEQLKPKKTKKKGSK